MRRLRLVSRLNARGISIVELLIGLSLIAIVVTSLAAASLYASRLVTSSRLQLAAAEFQQSELERLLALPYTSLASDSRTTSKGTARWEVEDYFSYRRIFLVTHYTPAPGLSVWDSVAVYRLEP